MSNSDSRRDILRNAALAATLGGIPEALMTEVHVYAAEDKAATGGVYKPKVFSATELKTARVLCELIVPADDVSPSALAGGAPEFIDLLASMSDELSTILLGGLHWLDNQVPGGSFADAPVAEQTALLDKIAYRKNEKEYPTGVPFFDLFRRMTVDAFYTSKAGIADIGYKGNKGMTKFEVPLASLDHALKRSPV
jgi:hypothetical protein